MNPSTTASQLSPQQREVLNALVLGSTITEAAAKTGVHRSTIHNWTRANTIFRAALRDAQSQQSDVALDGIRARTTKALDTIEALMSDPAAPANVRMRAAMFILQTTMHQDPYANSQNEPELTMASVATMIEAAAHAEEENSETNPAPSPVPEAESSVPRSAPCPCGSGEKFKRCCGRTAPGVINQARAA